MRLLTASLLVAFVLLLFGGCKSKCSKLCETQVKCSGAYDNASDQPLHPDKQKALCITWCQAMEMDPAKSAALGEVQKCANTGCDGFQACVEAAVAQDEKQQQDEKTAQESQAE